MIQPIYIGVLREEYDIGSEDGAFYGVYIIMCVLVRYVHSNDFPNPTKTSFTQLVLHHINITIPIAHTAPWTIIMVGKKSIKIFAACAAAVAIVVGLSIGITQGNESRSTNANYGMVAEVISKYECVESTVSGGAKSGKSGGGRRMIVPGTEDYLRVKVPANQRRRLASELLRFRSKHVVEGVVYM